jgi:hypothetical protein
MFNVHVSDSLQLCLCVVLGPVGTEQWPSAVMSKQTDDLRLRVMRARITAMPPSKFQGNFGVEILESVLRACSGNFSDFVTCN